MSIEDKKELIADILELEVEEVSEDMVLEDIETWDSVAVLSFIAIMDSEFNKYPHASEIECLQTIGDLFEMMVE